ncbi:MAG: hypothetical protein RBT49_09590 [Bacteroidales bacterium]|jgi:hypothetical protein|nr:hypothetical protein [Bacteroidales bacterium]
MEVIQNTGIFENASQTKKIYAKKPGVFYRIKDEYRNTTFSESYLSDKKFRFDTDDWFMPSPAHIDLNGNKYFFGYIFSSIDNGDEWPKGMGGEGILINPAEIDWSVNPTMTDEDKAKKIITYLIDNNLTIFRNLLLSVDKIVNLINSYLPEYSNLNEYYKLLWNNKNQLLNKLDVELIQTIHTDINNLFYLNGLFNIGSYSFKNRQYTTLPEYINLQRNFSIFLSYTAPILLSVSEAPIMQNERAIIYKVDFDVSSSYNILTYLGNRSVAVSDVVLNRTFEILDQLDISDFNNNSGDTNTGTDNNSGGIDTGTGSDNNSGGTDSGTVSDNNSGETKSEKSTNILKLMTLGFTIFKLLK